MILDSTFSFYLGIIEILDLALARLPRDPADLVSLITKLPLDPVLDFDKGTGRVI